MSFDDENNILDKADEKSKNIQVELKPIKKYKIKKKSAKKEDEVFVKFPLIESKNINKSNSNRSFKINTNSSREIKKHTRINNMKLHKKESTFSDSKNYTDLNNNFKREKSFKKDSFKENDFKSFSKSSFNSFENVKMLNDSEISKKETHQTEMIVKNINNKIPISKLPQNEEYIRKTIKKSTVNGLLMDYLEKKDSKLKKSFHQKNKEKREKREKLSSEDFSYSKKKLKKVKETQKKIKKITSSEEEIPSNENSNRKYEDFSKSKEQRKIKKSKKQKLKKKALKESIDKLESKQSFNLPKKRKNDQKLHSNKYLKKNESKSSNLLQSFSHSEFENEKKKN